MCIGKVELEGLEASVAKKLNKGGPLNNLGPIGGIGFENELQINKQKFHSSSDLFICNNVH